eukprot:1152301-Pelagomonas_calceolata.AAC.3
MHGETGVKCIKNGGVECMKDEKHAWRNGGMECMRDEEMKSYEEGGMKMLGKWGTACMEKWGRGMHKEGGLGDA